jgi:hypothetical protein
MRGAARVLLWTVWCALAAAVPAGTALLLMWLVLEMWRAGYHWLVLFLFLEGGLLVSVGVLILTFRYARRHWTERPGRWKSVVCFVGVLAVLAGWFVALVLGPMDVDQQILHDRGVTATGLVTRAWHDEGDSGPTNFQFDVRLGDGTTIDVGGVRPGGRTVHRTYFPQGRADPHPPPGTRPPTARPAPGPTPGARFQGVPRRVDRRLPHDSEHCRRAARRNTRRRNTRRRHTRRSSSRRRSTVRSSTRRSSALPRLVAQP